MSAKVGLREAISIGIGGMVGGGIFAVLGLAVLLAKGGTPFAFLVAGVIAFFTAYTYSKLSVVFPDRGGTVKFINQGFGKGVFSGAVNNLLWFSYIIMLSLYASAFGSYAPNLYSITGDASFDFHIYASFVVVFAAVINYYSIAVVGKIESIAVIIKLIILLIFVVLGLFGLKGNENIDQLYLENWESPMNVLVGGMVIFVAYEGFELIANAAPDIKEPEKNIPKAYMLSVGFVILLYFLIALITVGSLPFSIIGSSEDYVLAVAAKPMLGESGFTIITIAALISTFSAINASLYGGSRVSYEIAEDDELPHEFAGKLWNQPIGLLITVLATLVLTNVLELESISIAGSIGFLFIFCLVNLLGVKLRKEIKSNLFVCAFGALACMVALIALVVQQYASNFKGVIVSCAIVAFCFFIEAFFKTWEKHRLK